MPKDKKNANQHIKRPMNKFIIFKTELNEIINRFRDFGLENDFLTMLYNRLDSDQQAAFAWLRNRKLPIPKGDYGRATGALWKKAPQDVIDRYSRDQEAEKQEHKKQNPDYFYRPIKKDKKKNTEEGDDGEYKHVKGKRKGKGKGKLKSKEASNEEVDQDVAPSSSVESAPQEIYDQHLFTVPSYEVPNMYPGYTSYTPFARDTVGGSSGPHWQPAENPELPNMYNGYTSYTAFVGVSSDYQQPVENLQLPDMYPGYTSYTPFARDTVGGSSGSRQPVENFEQYNSTLEQTLPSLHEFQDAPIGHNPFAHDIVGGSSFDIQPDAQQEDVYREYNQEVLLPPAEEVEADQYANIEHTDFSGFPPNWVSAPPLPEQHDGIESSMSYGGESINSSSDHSLASNTSSLLSESENSGDFHAMIGLGTDYSTYDFDFDQM